MSRMSRFDRLNRVAPPRKKFTVKEVLGKLKRDIKRRFIAEGHIVDPSTRIKRYRWTWSYQGHGDVVLADTRSEAKSIIKELLGIKKGRLPKEVTLVGESTVAHTG